MANSRSHTRKDYATFPAAGSTQSTATPIVRYPVMFVTVTASSQGVRFQSSPSDAGIHHELFNNGAVNVKVYPATGGRIGTGATNAAYTLNANTGTMFVSDTTGNWRVLKVADDQPIQFDVQTGFDDSLIQNQVRASVARMSTQDGCAQDLDGLSHILSPASLPAHMQGKPLHLYANGPSAIDAPHHFPSIALNGAHSLFGPELDAWIACDPQPMVAGFVAEPKLWTRYMVASKCHPAVFDALHDHAPQIWHVDDCGRTEIPAGAPRVATAVSVTITALGLLYQLGAREIHVYGWDCCYIGGRDHAVSQGHDASQDIVVDVDGQTFISTPAWACECEDAAAYLNLLPGLSLHIHGPGMIGAILRYRGLI